MRSAGWLVALAFGYVQAETFEPGAVLEGLPYARPETRIGYTGSIDKRGGNADWTWVLYPDARGEWVLFDADGPGCLCNFVAHRDQQASDPLYRFYFDGAETPAFEIRHSEFGKKIPFVEPLAASYDPKAAGCRDKRLTEMEFRIVRSFVPMPYAKSCRVTSSVPLDTWPPGGWGHVVAQSFASADGVTTFTGNEDWERILTAWRNVDMGSDPKPDAGNETFQGQTGVPAGGAAAVFSENGAGSVTSIRFRVKEASQAASRDLWLRLCWDGEPLPAAEVPFGAFFGNEIGQRFQRYLTHGMTTNGEFYCFFPMPYWQSARIEVLNRSESGMAEVTYEIRRKPVSALDYPRGRAMHFRASPYVAPHPKPANGDTVMGVLKGRGHLVAGLVTSRNSMCEGDVRVTVDGMSTPSVQSDGSESWSCYGWGFVNPGQQNPFSGFDGAGNSLWSMTRVCLADAYPFLEGLRFTVEGGDGSRKSGQRDVRSGMLFYYGEPEPGMDETDTVDFGDETSERAHACETHDVKSVCLESVYEGEKDNAMIQDTGYSVRGSIGVRVKLAADNAGILLFRRSDQCEGRQRAEVWVDGVRVNERDWYRADKNPHQRWQDDTFQIPARYSAGKHEVMLRFVRAGGTNVPAWSVFALRVCSIRPQDGRRDTSVSHAFLGTSHALKKIYIRDVSGRTVWDYPVSNPQDVWLLPNGNVLTTWLHGVKEITPEKKTVWEYTVHAPNEVPSCQPLPDGSVMIGIVGECRLIEVNRKGEVLHEVKLATTENKPHAQFRMCRKTKEGNYLVPFTAEGALREYDRDGRCIRRFPALRSPVCALRLPNGNTLVSADGGVTEYDAKDAVVWRLDFSRDLPDIACGIPAGIQRLPNGNTVVCNWGASTKGGKRGVSIIEVTPDKRPVWRVPSDGLEQVAQCQLLTGGLKKRDDHDQR